MTLLNLTKNDIGYLRLLIDLCSIEDTNEENNFNIHNNNNNSSKSKIILES